MYRLKPTQGESHKLHSLEITPRMRASILKGMSAYHEGGAVEDSPIRVAKAMGGPIDDDTRKWLDDSKVVDEQGQPLIVYRGEHGEVPQTKFHARVPNSISFGSREGANQYAEHPNDHHDGPVAPRVTPAYLKIRNPVLHDTSGDPFFDLSDIEKKVGRDEAMRIAHQYADHIEGTSNWIDGINRNGEFQDVKDFLKKHPKRLGELYVDAYPVLDDPKFVKRAIARGYDGAIHGGNGSTGTETEYRIFHPDQAKSAISPHLAQGGTADLQLPKAAGGAVDHHPSEAQKAAGNYRKEHLSFQGLPIALENKRGSVRRGRDHRGQAWSCVLPADYGYIKGTEGADGDHVDVFLGQQRSSHLVVVVNQVDHKTKKFDEHKVMLGFGSEKEAIDCYARAFSDGKGRDRIGSVEVMSVDAFKHWLKRGRTAKRASGPSIIDQALSLTSRFQKGSHHV